MNIVRKEIFWIKMKRGGIEKTNVESRVGCLLVLMIRMTQVVGVIAVYNANTNVTPKVITDTSKTCGVVVILISYRLTIIF